MRLSAIHIKNFRSIVDSGPVRIEPMQGLVGENNAGKSNVLKAIDCFLSAGVGGVRPNDFNSQDSNIEIEATFSDLSDYERRNLRRYLLGDTLVLRKEISLEVDERSGKEKVETSYRGYIAQPTAWWLSVDGVVEHTDRQRPNWRDAAVEAGILEFVQKEDGGVDKRSYETGIARILVEDPNVEFGEPELADGKALGIQQNLLRFLPDFYLLPAITDYSDEIDKRSSTTVFRRLMAELADRIIKSDPRYVEIENALNTLHELLNPTNVPEAENEAPARLAVLSTIEGALGDVISRLIPTVERVQLGVAIEETRDLFSKGVNLKVHDGVMTDVVDKGHGLQRSVVFGLLQVLIRNTRGELIEADDPGNVDALPSIILAIEEPELYIHPQSQRLIYRVLEEFASPNDAAEANRDQVVYTTHSPSFVDIARYWRVAIAKKDAAEVGTIVSQCDEGVLGDPEEKRTFQLLNAFSVQHNEMFFAKHVVLVEGEQDEIAILATGRKIGLFDEFPEELGVSIVQTSGKGQMAKFQQVLNAFGANYSVWLEMDGHNDAHRENAPIIALAGDKAIARLPRTLEHAAGLGNHFNSSFQCKEHFCDPTRVTDELETLVSTIIPQAQQ